MDKFSALFFTFGVGVIFTVLMAAVFPEVSISYKNGYKQGQIDAYNSEYKYELKKQKDGTVTWVRKR